MIIEKCDNSPTFFRVRNASFNTIQHIKRSVRDKYRYMRKGYWYIHFAKVVEVAKLELSLGNKLTWEGIPNKLGNKLSSLNIESTNISHENIDDPYAVLFLRSGAPEYVVKAVWKVLAFECHPDRGGDPKEFARIRHAYSKIEATW